MATEPHHLITLYAPTDAVRSAVWNVMELAGVKPAILTSQRAPGGVLQLVEVRAGKPMVRAQFHPLYAPYLAEGSVDIVLPEQEEDLLELVVAAGSTQRGKIIGVVGVNGGVGASVTAIWLAKEIRESAKAQKVVGFGGAATSGALRQGYGHATGDSHTSMMEETVCLVDMDPSGWGLEGYCGIEDAPGLRWQDIREEDGVLLPGRVSAALPRALGIPILTGDERGGVPGRGDVGRWALDALSQAFTITIVDLPREALWGHNPSMTTWKNWCDVLILHSGESYREFMALEQAVARCEEDGGGRPPILRCAALGSSLGMGAAWSEKLGRPVRVIRKLRNFTQDCEHGLYVGHRRRSTTAKDIRALMKDVLA
ncbi:hypothetical protein R6G85_04570 [Actinotignum urinale]|uniref:hypothetical protein n=1 Tax=Actinotignum urinale TaxID=190146 RepID=UPI002A83905C|nr:hypothetical protein [Actinotignum urinale]MDY5151759.1 hypothetical protein [Actinotignum urinale]